MISNYSLLLFIFTCFIRESAGRESIVNGYVVQSVDQFPYVVSLHYENWGHDCVGGIIADNFILTAAHCVVQSDNNIENTTFSVVAGTKNANHTQPPAVMVKVKTILVPKKYTANKIDTSADIAVLMLKHSLGLETYNRHLKSLKLPISHAIYADKTALVAGYGWNWIEMTKDNKFIGGSDGQLRYAEAIIRRKGQHGYHCQTNAVNQMCAQVKQEQHQQQQQQQQQHSTLCSKARGLCKGDSGAPLVYNGIVIGIASVSKQACSENYTGAMYTRVSHYVKFIKDAMKYYDHEKQRHDIRILELQH